MRRITGLTQATPVAQRPYPRHLPPTPIRGVKHRRRNWELSQEVELLINSMTDQSSLIIEVEVDNESPPAKANSAFLDCGLDHMMFRHVPRIRDPLLNQKRDDLSLIAFSRQLV